MLAQIGTLLGLISINMTKLMLHDQVHKEKVKLNGREVCRL